MLCDIAVTPAVLCRASYSERGAGLSVIHMIKDRVRKDTVVRDLCDGQWLNNISEALEVLSPHGKELLKWLRKNKRLYRHLDQGVAKTLPDEMDDKLWCEIALSSQKDLPDCVITTEETKRAFEDAMVVSGEKLSGHDWWTRQKNSFTLNREISDYLQKLDRVLRLSNSLQFIDPHLDPRQKRYSDFWRLIERASRDVAPPIIEIHRACYVGSGPQRHILSHEEWQEVFENYLKPRLQGLSVEKVEVFVWDDLHDRFLISDLIGMSLANGFDTDGKKVRWTRLDENEKEDVEKDVDPNCNPSKLRGQFCIYRRDK